MEDQSTTPGSEGHRPDEAIPPLRESVSSAGERIQVIIEAAEKAAAGIIEDADAQAHRYIEASRERADVLADERVRVMSDLTDTLIRQAELVKRQSDELLSALDSARKELSNRIGQELSPSAGRGGQAPAAGGFGESRVPHLQPVETAHPGLQAVGPADTPQPAPQAAPAPPPPPVQQTGPQPPPPPQPSGQPAGAATSDGARLLAAQMAVAGSSRQEIEARLRAEFGIEDAAPILDGILGPG